MVLSGAVLSAVAGVLLVVACLAGFVASAVAWGELAPPSHLSSADLLTPQHCLPAKQLTTLTDLQETGLALR